jgi:glycosyltransferase involved in cell wall biosynthesis
MAVKSTLAILTFNEIEGVRALFDKIPFHAVDECLVVDGGSFDGTIEFFRGKNLKVIIQEKKGRGEAFRIAARQAAGDRLVFFSPDGNEDPRDIPKLLDCLGDCDMAIASRFLKGSHNEEDGRLFPWRAWANRVFTFLANAVWNKGEYISDTINGFRAVTKRAFQGLNLDAASYVIEYQMSIRSMKSGLRVKEIPTREGGRIGGKSKVRSIPAGLQFLRVFIRELLNNKKINTGA